MLRHVLADAASHVRDVGVTNPGGIVEMKSVTGRTDSSGRGSDTLMVREVPGAMLQGNADPIAVK